MPSSVTHLRVCDKLIGLVDERFHTDFAVGNIAPDCGRRVPGTKSYDPPRHITHWTDTPQRWNTKPYPDRFYDEYLREVPDMRAGIFRLGYYCHLVTDSIYIDYYTEFHDKLGEAFDTEFRKKLKYTDQNWLDADFMRQNPELYPAVLLKNAGTYFDQGLDYYSRDAISIRMADIIAFELNGEPGDKPESMIIGESDCEAFVNLCADRLYDFVKNELDRFDICFNCERQR